MKLKMLKTTAWWDEFSTFDVEQEDAVYFYFENLDDKYCAIEKKLEGQDFEIVEASSSQEYYQKNREDILEQKKQYRSSLKKAVIDKLGGRCVKCGYTGEALDIKGGQPRGRKEGYSVYLNRILRTVEMFPNHEYHLMCANCIKEAE